MKILIFWDVYGRKGREALKKELPVLRKKYACDFVIANIENATGGKWPVTEHARELSSLWIEVMTWGDHIYDNAPNIYEYFQSPNCNLIRPANFYESNHTKVVGNGFIIVQKWDMRLLVIQLLGEVFMNHKVYNPFLCIEKILQDIPKDTYDACVVDFHRETTAELYGMAHFLDGKVQLVYGTHTHVQTHDAHILPKGTALICDVGMNGPLYSVIGADYASVEKRFLGWVQRGKIEQALSGPYRINALYLEIDEKTQKVLQLETISYIQGKNHVEA